MRLLIVDDHVLVRQALVHLISSMPEVTAIDEASNGAEAVQSLRQSQYDLLIMDLTMPGRSGLDLLKTIKSEHPRLPILVLSMHDESTHAVRSYRAGASGYLNKSQVSEELFNAIRKIRSGGIYANPDFLAQALFGDSENNQKRGLELLTDRETQVLERIVQGESLSEIANELCLSIKTVSTHKVRIQQKLGVNSTAQLIRYAMEHGFASPTME